MEAYRDVLRDEVLPHGRDDEQCGLSWLPDGDAAYAATLRYYTTTTKTAQEIHDIGLEQIDKLADEYRSLGPEVVGTDDLQQIFEAMRTDPKLHFSTGEELVEASEVAMQRAWEAMPEWFEVLPQARCGVQSTMTGAKAFYFPPAGDGSRGGTFFVNVADPTSWGIFELEAMAFHEGIPGHHLQLAIASELEGVPEFRKHIHNAAYAEGWGLYTERLSDEMGLYSRPSTGWGCSPPTRCGRAVSSSTPACTPWAGAVRRRSSTWSPTHPSPREWCGRRSTATSSRRARRPPTWSGDSRSSGCAPRPRRARVAPSR